MDFRYESGGAIADWHDSLLVGAIVSDSKATQPAMISAWNVVNPRHSKSTNFNKRVDPGNSQRCMRE